MGAAAYIVYSLFHVFTGNTFSTMMGILAGAVVYGIGLVAFHGITIEEIAAFPKGHLIIKMIRKLGLLRE